MARVAPLDLEEAKGYDDDGIRLPEPSTGGGGAMKKNKLKSWGTQSSFATTDDDVEGLGEDFLDSPWVPPKMDVALEHRNIAMVAGGEASVCGFSSSQISDLGTGVGLYFKWLELFGIGFLIMSFMAIVPLFIYSLGENSSDGEMLLRDPVKLSTFSLGNNAPCLGSGECEYNETLTVFGYVASRQVQSNFITATDFMYTLVFMLLIFIFKRKIANSVDDERFSSDASEYAIYVQGLPADATSHEIRDHFNDLYSLNQPDWEHAGCCCGLVGKKLPRHPKDILDRGKLVICDITNKTKKSHDPIALHPVCSGHHNGDHHLVGGYVAEVSVARKQGDVIRKFQRMKGLHKKQKELRAAVKKFSEDTPWPKGPDPKLRKKAQLKLAKVEWELENRCGPGWEVRKAAAGWTREV